MDFSDDIAKGVHVYGELVTDAGRTWRLTSGEIVDTVCYWMSGGTFKLMQFRTLRADKTLMEVPLPYINGVDVQISVG